MNRMNPTRILPMLLMFTAMALILTACAESVPVEDCVSDEPYGFFGGLWHGIIAPVSFVFSLFDDDVAMYAVNNSGGWYDFGFVLGAGILFGGSGKAAK
jgi:hypothetical protein